MSTIMSSWPPTSRRRPTSRWAEAMGAPLLPGAVGFLVCEVERHVDGGDHVVLLGNVVHTKVAGGQPPTYHGRVFGAHMALAG